MAATCPSCGAGLQPGDRFCPRCGAPTDSAPEPGSSFCTSCGAPLAPGDRFCGRCGAAAHPAPREEAEETAPAEPLQEEWPEGLDLEPEAGTPPAVPVAGAPTVPVPRAPAAPPTEALPPQPPPPAVGKAREGFPVGAALALLGGMAVAASALPEWATGDLGGLAPRDVPAKLLLDPDAGPGGPSLAVTLIALGAAGSLVAIVSMLAPLPGFLRRMVGALTLAVPILFAARLAQALRDPGPSLFEVLGPGAYVAAAGALSEVLAGRRLRR